MYGFIVNHHFVVLGWPFYNHTEPYGLAFLSHPDKSGPEDGQQLVQSLKVLDVRNAYELHHKVGK